MVTNFYLPNNDYFSFDMSNNLRGQAGESFWLQ